MVVTKMLKGLAVVMALSFCVGCVSMKAHEAAIEVEKMETQKQVDLITAEMTTVQDQLAAKQTELDNANEMVRRLTGDLAKATAEKKDAVTNAKNAAKAAQTVQDKMKADLDVANAKVEELTAQIEQLKAAPRGVPSVPME